MIFFLTEVLKIGRSLEVSERSSRSFYWGSFRFISKVKEANIYQNWLSFSVSWADTWQKYQDFLGIFLVESCPVVKTGSCAPYVGHSRTRG